MHCKSSALRTFLPCALGVWELSLRINFIGTSRTVPRCIRAVNSILFPKENTYSFTGSLGGGESRAKLGGGSLLCATPGRTRHRGSPHPPEPARLGTPAGDVPSATITPVIRSVGSCHRPVPLRPPLCLSGIAMSIAVSLGL